MAAALVEFETIDPNQIDDLIARATKKRTDKGMTHDEV